MAQGGVRAQQRPFLPSDATGTAAIAVDQSGDGPIRHRTALQHEGVEY